MPSPPVVAGHSLLMDFDPDALAAGAVSSWTEGLGKTFTQANTALQPTCVEGVLNGHNVVDFDGKWLSVSGGLNLPWQAMTMFFVMAQIGASARARSGLLGLCTSSGNDWDQANGAFIALTADTSETDWSTWILGGVMGSSNDVDIRTVTSTPFGTFAVATMECGPSIAPQLYIDGTTDGTTASRAASPTFQWATLGGRQKSSADPARWRCGRVLVYAGTLDATERSQVHSALQDTYGVQVADYVPSTEERTGTGSAMGLTVALGAGVGSGAPYPPPSDLTLTPGPESLTLSWTAPDDGPFDVEYELVPADVAGTGTPLALTAGLAPGAGTRHGTSAGAALAVVAGLGVGAGARGVQGAGLSIAVDVTQLTGTGTRAGTGTGAALTIAVDLAPAIGGRAAGGIGAPLALTAALTPAGGAPARTGSGASLVLAAFLSAGVGSGSEFPPPSDLTLTPGPGSLTLTWVAPDDGPFDVEYEAVPVAAGDGSPLPLTAGLAPASGTRRSAGNGVELDVTTSLSPAEGVRGSAGMGAGLAVAAELGTAVGTRAAADAGRPMPVTASLGTGIGTGSEAGSGTGRALRFTAGLQSGLGVRAGQGTGSVQPLTAALGTGSGRREHANAAPSLGLTVTLLPGSGTAAEAAAGGGTPLALTATLLPGVGARATDGSGIALAASLALAAGAGSKATGGTGTPQRLAVSMLPGRSPIEWYVGPGWAPLTIAQPVRVPVSVEVDLATASTVPLAVAANATTAEPVLWPATREG